MSARSAQRLARSAPSDALRKVVVARPSMPTAHVLAPYLAQMDEARWYSNFGPLLRAFEQRLADRFAPPAFVATAANGTLALTLALQAMGAEAGGFCAVPAWTFVATAHAVIQAGLVPWFVDVDPQTWMIDPARLEAALGEAPGRIAAALPVAAFGRVPDLAAWARFRERTGIPVLLDAAAAFDALAEAPVPAMVSLHATKALGVGEGGFVVSEDDSLIATIRELTTFGFRGSRESRRVATNAKLSEYAAAVGLASLDGWPAARLRYGLAAQRLRIALADQPAVAFQDGWGVGWVSSVCVVRLPDGAADAVEAHLTAAGIETRRWWGAGCHASPAFAAAPRADLATTETLAASTLGLPFAADLTADEVERVAKALANALSHG
ncbi:MAG TPA: DegT/DnrJ/EryC1/StrS family aminotransferase [Caulobacteraceae bacterium]|jgi:dTDP-4-amino-4,6-dideoxygalactose transaminase|nr:DegT/DnrJ/EryC1/StrS family aminotransferase [Caulobacteraceae bacterium]